MDRFTVVENAVKKVLEIHIKEKKEICFLIWAGIHKTALVKSQKLKKFP